MLNIQEKVTPPLFGNRDVNSEWAAVGAGQPVTPQSAAAQTGWGQQGAVGTGGLTQPPQAQQQGFGQMNTGTPQAPAAGLATQQAPTSGGWTQKQRPASHGKGVFLKKGNKTPLVGANGQQLLRIDVGLGWDSAPGYDLDASCFLLGADGKVIGDDWFVFYGQPASPDGAVQHSGDSTTGAAMGDDEVISVDLTHLNPSVKKLVFIVTINEALTLGLNFSGVKNAYIRIVDKQTGAEALRFNLSEYYATVTSMVVGEVYNHNGTWKLNPVGNGTAADLAGLCAQYGVVVND